MRRRLGLVLIPLTLLLGACQSVNQDAVEAEGLSADTLADEVKPVGPGGEIAVDADDLFFIYDGERSDSGEVRIEVPAGEIQVSLDNVGAAPHNFRVDEAVGDTKLVEASGGQDATGTLALFPGTYAFYCSIPGHRAAGMEGTLVVTAEAG